MATVTGAGLTLDVSYQSVDKQLLFQQLSLPEGFDDYRRQLLKGDYVNRSEQRSVTHTLCRSIHAVTGRGEKATRFDDTVQKVRSGRWQGATGKGVSTVVNIGVGGSDLGPNLGASALKEFANDAVLNAAGGKITTVDGEPLRYNQKESFLNPYFIAAKQ